jgi:hypothetical protein
MMKCSLLKSALLTVESGVVARVLEPSSGEAPEQKTQVNHNIGFLMGFELDLEKKISAERRKRNHVRLYVH